MELVGGHASVLLRFAARMHAAADPGRTDAPLSVSNTWLALRQKKARGTAPAGGASCTTGAAVMGGRAWSTGSASHRVPGPPDTMTKKMGALLLPGWLRLWAPVQMQAPAASTRRQPQRAHGRM